MTPVFSGIFRCLVSPAMTDFKVTDVPNLSTVSAQFLAMAPVRKMGLENADELFRSVEAQTELLKMTIKSDKARQYPPSIKYQEAFLKALIQKCEAKGYELGDDLYEIYTKLLSKVSKPETNECYRTYLLSNTDESSVTLKESVSIISKGTTGLNTWPAAGLLAEWVMENKDALCGRTVLELGSGMGLTGLTICKTCQPTRYIFSDCHASVLRGLKENIAINVPGEYALDCVAPESDRVDGTKGDRTSVECIDWEAVEKKDLQRWEAGFMVTAGEDVHDSVAPESDRVDSTKGDGIPDISVECIDWESVEEKDLQQWKAGVIIAADVIYDPRIIEPFVRLLHLLLRCQGDGQGRPTAYIASTIRNEATYWTFLQALDKHHVSMEKMERPTHKTLHFDRSCRIQIIRLWASVCGR